MKRTDYLYDVPASTFADMKPGLKRKIEHAKALRDRLLKKSQLHKLSEYDSMRLNDVIDAIEFNEKLLNED